MNFGIYLGNDYCAISTVKDGYPTSTLKDFLPTVVSVSKKGQFKVGDSALNDFNRSVYQTRNTVYHDFIRFLGLNLKFDCPPLNCSISPEELVCLILKELITFVNNENSSTFCITIPAKFKTNQIEAVKYAARMAGIERCELLQEPIAASMAYGLSAANEGSLWLVFDFGGGTFDAALLKVEGGIMQVKDTDGDNYLGGKNLDYAIVDEIIIPYLQENYVIDDILGNDTKKQILREAMKFYAEQTKNQLSFKDKWDITSQLDEFGDDDDGIAIELDMVITKEQMQEVLSPIFQKAVDICKNLLSRNNLTGKDLDSLILVGGPTYSPVLRNMLKEQITPNVDTSIDPMTPLAKGAALYSSLI